MKYVRTKRLENHETETLEATVFLESSENPDAVFNDLKSFVLEKLVIKSETVMGRAFKKAVENG